jgi:hypothetical protein
VFSQSSKARLTLHDLDRFPDETVFHRAARAVCRAECLPRKELYEAWEVARRARRLFRGGRIVDLGAGHGLLAHLLLILDDSSPDALVVDKVLPPSAAKLHTALVETWPRLARRVLLLEQAFDAVELARDDVVVSSHACGSLTDVILARAIASRCRVAVLPCCQHTRHDARDALSGWIDDALAIDVRRAVALEQGGYRVWTQTIAENITPKNRLLMGTPVD